jgi:ribosome-associated toxin RatA of RatAB toxin-antitoxin module
MALVTLGVRFLGLGGRARVRRGLSAAVALAASTAVLCGATIAAAPVTVLEERGLYRVSASFVTRQDASIVRAVLTDYEQIPRFMPDVTSSRVLSRDAGQVVVEQEATARVLFFSRRIHLRLVIEERHGTIAFKDACGRSFAEYEGRWTLREEADQTVVAYELAARPAFDVPGFILTRVLRRDADRMIANLQAEMAARAAAAVPPTS